MNQEKYCAKLREIMRSRVEANTNKFVGTYNTFKEARKNAREVAKYTYYGYITKENNKFVVTCFSMDGFDFYVHKDGRVCSVNDLECENKKWNKHPEIHNPVRPFGKVRNREKNESKKDYINEMSVYGRYDKR